MRKKPAKKIEIYFMLLACLFFLSSCSHQKKNNIPKLNSNNNTKYNNIELPSFEKDKKWILQTKNIQDKNLASAQHKKKNNNLLQASWSAYKSNDFGRALVFINSVLEDSGSDSDTIRKSNKLKAAILKKLNVTADSNNSKLTYEAIKNKDETIKK
jgi:hypothetical protein